MISSSKRLVARLLGVTVLSAPLLLRSAEVEASKTDAQFMQKTAEADMISAHIGQMAEAQALAQGVKDIGKRLSDDHSTSYEGLSVLASKTGQAIPKAIVHDTAIARLGHLKGKHFDQSFLKEEIQSEKMSLTAFQDEVAHGADPQVKTWAKTMIPILQGDLQSIESLAKSKK